MPYLEETYDIVVVGAGHAGCEAALACARLGLETIVFTVSVDSIALMPCNPNVGGSSKGHLVRELDALGGEMGKNIDKTFIQSKMLNESKGPAVHSLRAQADKQEYSRQMRKTMENTEHLTIRQAEVSELIVEDGAPCYRLSRAEAQRLCKAEYLDTLSPGDILPCTVTHIEPFGAFCDVGCGISALLPIDCMSVSRISSPADRVSVGQQILCAIKNRDAQGRFVLTIRELLGTWAENAARFTVGETVVGIVRSVEEYGTFVEIAPNLAGLAESCSGLAPGQAVSVYIKNILPEKMKIKLVIVNHALSQPHRFELRYFITEGHLDRWVYSTPECPKRIETDFAVAACNPG